jgi:hypothetical protein
MTTIRELKKYLESFPADALVVARIDHQRAIGIDFNYEFHSNSLVVSPMFKRDSFFVGVSEL